MAAPSEPDEAPAETEEASGPFHFEMGEEPPASPESAFATPSAARAATDDLAGEAAPRVDEPSAAAAPPQSTVAEPTPTSVNIHYATNRNRLTPKDREWLVYFFGFFTSLPAFVIYALVILALLVFPWFGKRSWAGAPCSPARSAYVRWVCWKPTSARNLADELSGELYGCRATEISYGNCEISVPRPENRRPGDLSRPVSVWIFEAPENPDKHFMLRHVEEHKDKDEFYRSLSARLDKSEARAAMLFIHGYNVSFEDAIFRTAQLAVDLKFPGAAMAFSWPSYADPVKYTFDEQNAEVSIPALREVLKTWRPAAAQIAFTSLPTAWEIGSWPERLAAWTRPRKPATRRCFASWCWPHPISTAGYFNRRCCRISCATCNTAPCMPRLATGLCACLRAFHNYQRLGETQPELLVATELDTIDASLVDTSLLGHSYIGDVQSIVSDLHDLVVGGKRPMERLGLESMHAQRAQILVDQARASNRHRHGAKALGRLESRNGCLA